MAAYAHFLPALMQMADKTANQGTKNPAGVFHATQISNASVARPNETKQNHVLSSFENGHVEFGGLV